MVDREEFNATVAPRLAEAAGVKGAPQEGVSHRFAWIDDGRRLTVVAGPGEGRYCDLALAYGLGEAGKRKLRLILPEEQAGATLHRLAWLDGHARVEVLTYASLDAVPERRRIPTRSEILKQYQVLAKNGDLEAEFRRATVPLHLRERATWVASLVDWVASRDDLDPAHRRGERAWHYRGQKVLSLTRVSKPRPGVRVRAGIQREDLQAEFVVDGPLDPARLREAQDAIERGISLRRTQGEEFHRPDEHWLQAVLRRNAHLVGLEMRALREVPAWRRAGSLDAEDRKGWGRGYIDLLGIDAHGTVQVVETKLASNNDPLFILQGIDYLAYCEAYREPITRRLDVDPRAPFGLAYVIGARRSTELKLSRFAPAQLSALAPDVAYQVTSLTGWFHSPRRVKEAETRDLDESGVRSLAKQ
jgi:hypothetical protein